MNGQDTFPPGFFSRTNDGNDGVFYGQPRLVTHIDDDAIRTVGELYRELGVSGDVLDLMGSWISHFDVPPRRLTVLGMNAAELAANASASERTVHDLNVDPSLPYADATFDDVVCCVSVDYLTRPIEVFRDVARVLRPGGRFVCTFSNRVFPTKAIRGWLQATEAQRREIVATYFLRSGVFATATVARRTSAAHRGDPLDAVWAVRLD